MNHHRLKVLKTDGEACNLKNETIDTCDVQQGGPVTLLLQEDNTNEVVGGHNSYKFQLNCTDEGVYTVISTSKLEVKPPTPLIPLKQPAYHAISLTIQDSVNQIVTDTVHIGQELKLIMEISDAIPCTSVLEIHHVACDYNCIEEFGVLAGFFFGRFEDLNTFGEDSICIDGHNIIHRDAAFIRNRASHMSVFVIITK
ncbi:unnamed protein product [Mytilus edulis]|uniref:Uncharacterized protein n=1 Tax=Mytilus edulis TaxID=6550 RepID=A0A8S3PPA1_MYTED|nr:unnamed protein product [Mytilus edulis]